MGIKIQREARKSEQLEKPKKRTKLIESRNYKAVESDKRIKLNCKREKTFSVLDW